jgi:hypothetical protein
MTLTSSSVLGISLCVVQLPIVPKSVQCGVIMFCSVNGWTILIVSGWFEWIDLTTDDFDTEWDDSCPGLLETLAREAEWKAQEASNNAVQWGVQEMDG